MSSDKPMRVSFSQNGSEISEESVFDTLYDGLERLIETNRTNRNMRQLWRAPLIGTRYQPPDSSSRDLHYEQWRRNVPKIHAQIETPAGTFPLEVLARDNFDPGSIKKQPNIVLLRGSRLHDMLVLREARTYDEPFINEVISRSSRSIIRAFDHSATRGFIEGTQREAPEGFAYLPEPAFIRGVEKLTEQDGFPRITPYMMLVDENDTTSWYLREFLPLIRDSRFDPEAFGQYLGRIHHLGISEAVDRQFEHYAHAQDSKNIVNYDPDLLLITSKPSRLSHVDLGDVHDVLKSAGRTSTYRAIKRARIEELEELRGSQPEAQQRLLEYAQPI